MAERPEDEWNDIGDWTEDQRQRFFRDHLERMRDEAHAEMMRAARLLRWSSMFLVVWSCCWGPWNTYLALLGGDTWGFRTLYAMLALAHALLLAFQLSMWKHGRFDSPPELT